MAKIIIPTLLRKYTNNQSVIETKGNTVEEAILELTGAFKDLHQFLFDPKGDFQSFIRIFIGHVEINELDNKATAVEQGTVISIIPAFAGG